MKESLIMSWLSKWFNKSNAELKVLRTTIPEDLLFAISTRDFSQIGPLLEAWTKGSKVVGGAESVRVVAEQHGWFGDELEKLTAYTHYYSGEFHEAFERSKKFVDGDNFDPDMLVISAYSLYLLNYFELAYNAVNKADSHGNLFADRADFQMVKSLVCWSIGDMAQAAEAANKSLDLVPNDSMILQNALGIFIEVGDQERIAQVVAKLESMSCTGHAFGICLCALGDYRRGYTYMESRYSIYDVGRYFNPALLSLSRWQGESLVGRRLLLSAEQGLGDTIQMARFIPEMISLTKGKLAIETQPETVGLLQDNFPEIEVMPRGYDVRPNTDFDLWVGMMSLPHLLNTVEVGIPGCDGYLKAPREATDYWAQRVQELGGSSVPKIGIAWSGQPMHRNDRRRSIPMEVFFSFLPKDGAIFFALQTFVPDGLPGNVVRLTDELIGLADTAALIEQLDLVITVDTSVVHLSGALNRPTWLLLPHRYEWRWGLEGEHNDWYGSVTVLRQHAHGAWSELLEEVFGRRLNEFLNDR